MGKKNICITVILAMVLMCFSSHAMLIAGMGLPGCGKTTCLIELAKKFSDVHVLLEPKEESWPESFSNRSIDVFDFVTWLRAERVSNLRASRKIADEGGVAVVDSYYDKLFYHYLGLPQTEWLFPSEHPYFEVMKNIAYLDSINLPNADYIVFFKIDEVLWKKFLKKRNRENDAVLNTSEQFKLQNILLEVTGNICAGNPNIKLVIVEQSEGISPEQMADIIYGQIFGLQSSNDK